MSPIEDFAAGVARGIVAGMAVAISEHGPALIAFARELRTPETTTAAPAPKEFTDALDQNLRAAADRAAGA